VIDIKSIEERCERATKGPWNIEHQFHIHSNGRGICSTGAYGSNKDCEFEKVYQDNMANSDFIAHSREDLPALIEAVKEAKEIIWLIDDPYRPILKNRAKKWLKKIGGE
jgi:FMN phosphatase YigB (HAD superfamily)